MATQIQLRKNGAWVGIATIPSPSQLLLDTVRASKASVRLYDLARDRVLARSSAARLVKDPVRGRGVTPHKTFSEAREPDPYNVPEPHVLRTKVPGRYKPFAAT